MKEKLALIVVDMQRDFIKDRSLYSCQMLDDDLIRQVKRLIEFARDKKIPIIFTQHSIRYDKSNAEFGEPENVRACIIGTEGWKIIEELKPDSQDYIILKDKYDAFFGTKLENILKCIDIDTVIICGVLTNNCIRATAEGAHYRGFKIIIVEDCCGATSYICDFTHETIHDITLRDLKERMYETRLLKLNDILNSKSYMTY